MVRVVKILNDHKFKGYIEADGGVVLDNAGACYNDGARAFVGGSALIGQNDVRGVIRQFRRVILQERRLALLQKAHELGGTELVNKWIDLHLVGDKKNQLIRMAKEALYI